MGSPTVTTPGSHRGSNDENLRVKFLCSFSGSILPRPHDGKLRYVGGETRIVSAPREITYEDLMGRMRELFEGATLLKYQQPDEDLDALVSVVNDDDVTNMMEEYDKLGSGDGFTRLRIFLFSSSDQVGSVHFADGDERDNERRYVDALNSLNESPDLRTQLQHSESQILSSLDDYPFTEQYLNRMSLEGSHHNQRKYEIAMPQINLNHLNIPRSGSGQYQQSGAQRYNEMEAPCSPVYYSPRHHDPRPVLEFPSSPSSARYRTPHSEFSDRSFDRVSDEYSRQQVNRQSPQPTDNVVWVPTGTVAGDGTGFPGNILQGFNVFEGNNLCDSCCMTFPGNQVYAGEQQLEVPNMVNGFPPVNHCAECPPGRETLILNAEAKLQSPFYPQDQNDPRSLSSENQNHQIGWVPQHQSIARAEEPRINVSVAGRLNDHYIIDGNGMDVPIGHGNFPDAHHVLSHYPHHEDQARFMRPGPELGTDGFPDQVGVVGSSHIHIPLEERGVRYGNLPCAYGVENFYQVPHGNVSAHSLMHSPLHGTPTYEASNISQQPDGTPGFFRGAFDDSARFRIGLENQNPWDESSLKMGALDGLAVPHSHAHVVNLMPNTCNMQNQRLVTSDSIHLPHDILNAATHLDPMTHPDSASTLIDEKLVPLVLAGSESRTNLIRMRDKSINGVNKEINHGEKIDGSSNIPCISGLAQTQKQDNMASPMAFNSNFLVPPEEGGGVENEELQVDCLSFIPELIASGKKGVIESAKEIKAEAQGHAEEIKASEEIPNDLEAVDAHGDSEMGSDSDNNVSNSKIEPTKAEAEAIARGLQTIRNDDLEEFRELGSGTYGAVYHGKWKGSDVAIKRIKASCFAGRPSERERLIADFWKEALILGSLHHPNVVSFYGIVRDGPDGSLATVTEFMVNGSLKQFLQKKDRTIDRRKRLIIAMDAAFGMEYLHGKSIVHFDLKCENLLVNMRDPHRPVCKIGDLGLSKVKQHTLVSGGVRGTLPWMAPELLSGKSNMVTETIDVYSFGIVMWELLTGDEPYAGMHCAAIIGGIVNNSLRPQIPTWCDPEWKSLMESSWAPDPAQRPSFAEIAQRLRNMAASINVK